MNDVLSEKETDPLRVGYVLRMYPRFTQTFVVNEILELERQRVDVRILSLRKPTDGRFHKSVSQVRAKADYLPEFIQEAPAKIGAAHWSCLRAQPMQYVRAVAGTLRHVGIDATDLQQAAMLIRWARKQRVRHVHVHFGTHEASVAYLAMHMGGLSYSLTLHAFDIFRDNVNRALLARKINASRFTVTVSDYNRRFMVDQLPGVEPGKIVVNYNGIDLNTFTPTDVSRTPRSVLAVGRLIEKKGFLHLVRAVGRLRDEGLELSCVIVGDGPLKQALKKEIKKLKLRNCVKLAGALDQSRVQELMTASTCFALPCVRAKDGNVDALPTVLLEAMASGCPCVSTTISGVPEIIQHGSSGLLVTPGDESGLARAVSQILRDDRLASELADGGRRRAEDIFDIRKNVGQMKRRFCQTPALPAWEYFPNGQLASDGPRGVATVECGP